MDFKRRSRINLVLAAALTTLAIISQILEPSMFRTTFMGFLIGYTFTLFIFSEILEDFYELFGISQKTIKLMKEEIAEKDAQIFFLKYNNGKKKKKSKVE